jgi:folate-dependent phosphoribosylglycinamide formyltransferase PurN
LQREHQLLPQVVDWFAQGKLQLRDDRVWFEGSPLQAPIRC